MINRFLAAVPRSATTQRLNYFILKLLKSPALRDGPIVAPDAESRRDEEIRGKKTPIKPVVP